MSFNLSPIDPTRIRTVFADRFGGDGGDGGRFRGLGSGASGISAADPVRPAPNQLDRAPPSRCAASETRRLRGRMLGWCVPGK